MDNCWICGAKLKNPIRQYCARCYDKMLVEREKQEAKRIEKVSFWVKPKGRRRQKMTIYARR